MNNDGQFDFATEAASLLQAVDLFQGYSGLAKPISLLRGSQNQSIKRFHQHALHGVGKYKSEAYWKQLAEMLETNRMLGKSQKSLPGGFPYSVVEIKSSGFQWLRKSVPLWLKPTAQMLQFMRKNRVAADIDLTSSATGNRLQVPTSKETRQEQLAKALLECRTNLAIRYDAMPYMVASNLALEQMARAQPLNLAELKAANVDGMSDAKIRQFGDDFLKCILQQRNFLASSQPISDDSSMVHALQHIPMPDVRVSDCHLRLLPLLQSTKTIDQMAAEVGIKESSVVSYLSLLIKAGHPVGRRDIERLAQLSAQAFDAIAAVFPKSGDTLLKITLRPLKEALPTHFTYEQIKLVLAYAQVRAHLRQQGLPFDDPDDQRPSKPEVDQTMDTSPNEEPDVDDELVIDPDTVQEMLEDMNIPIEKTVDSQGSNIKSDSPLTVDWGSDWDDIPDAVDATVAKSEQPEVANMIPNDTGIKSSQSDLEDMFPSGDIDDEMMSHLDELESHISPVRNLPKAASSKRSPARIVPNKRIIYDSDTDDSGGDDAVSSVTATSTRPSPRKLPSWMLKRSATAEVPKVPAVVRKKPSLF